MNNASKWIDANKILPKDDLKVLVCCRTKKGIRSINMAYRFNDCWHGNGSMSGVTHWQPLPALPEE